MLDRYVAAGGSFLDTANCYAWWAGKGEFVGDESELVLGRWMKERRNRDALFLATKVGARLPNPATIRDAAGNVFWDRVPSSYEYLGAERIRQAVEGSLRRLQTDHIDLYYAHIDDRVTPLDETLGAFDALVRSGKVRYIACSNHRTWRLERARQLSAARGWASYVAVQNQYSYLRPKPGANLGVGVNVDDEQLDYLRANADVALIAYSPLLKGIYEDERKRRAYYNWSLFDTADSRERLSVLAALAAELGTTPHRLVYAWLLHQRQPAVIPIIGASRLAQLEEALGATDIRLTAGQMERLTAAVA
jgi:aryl-alcohol dehydrogenase-like predicted oxidoreductase